MFTFNCSAELLQSVPPLQAQCKGMYVSLCLNPSPLFSTGPSLPSDGDCSRECREEEVEVVEGCLIPVILLAEDNGQVDLEQSPVKEQVSENLLGR